MTESTDIESTEPGRAVAIAPHPSSGNMLQSIIEAARDPKTDAAKVESLVQVALTLRNDERKAEFSRAKIAAIQQMPAIYKRGQSDKHRYAKFEDLHRAVMPILARHGLTIDFKVGSSAKGISVTPIMRHENGYVDVGDPMEGPPDTGPGRSAVQAIGSTTSYFKRHLMKATLNLIEDGEDNDGVGFREGEQRNDRQERMILDAEEHATAGDYETWYRGLNNKDKAWLVLAGVHARCGGGTVSLPRARSSPQSQPEDEAIDATFEPVDERPPAADQRQADPPAEEAEGPKTNTPEGWTTKYERDCAAATTAAQLDKIQHDGRNALAKLSKEHSKLWEKADLAMLTARDRIAADDDTFPGDR